MSLDFVIPVAVAGTGIVVIIVFPCASVVSVSITQPVLVSPTVSVDVNVTVFFSGFKVGTRVVRVFPTESVVMTTSPQTVVVIPTITVVVQVDE